MLNGPFQTYDLLVVGHPRCGTGYSAKTLEYFGLSIGHERYRRNGIANWMYAVNDEPPYGFLKRKQFNSFIHCVRNPVTAINSFIMENSRRRSYEFRKKHIKAIFGLDLDKYSLIEKALLSFLCWNDIIEDYIQKEQKPSYVFKIDQPDLHGLKTFLRRNGLFKKKTFEDGKNPLSVYKGYNARPYITVVEPNDWELVTSKTMERLTNWRTRYGY